MYPIHLSSSHGPPPAISPQLSFQSFFIHTCMLLFSSWFTQKLASSPHCSDLAFSLLWILAISPHHSYRRPTFFLQLHISLWGWTIIYLTSPIEGHLGCFQSSAIANKAAVNNLVQSSLGTRASGSVWQFPEIEFLSQKVDAFKFSIDTAKLLSTRVEPTYVSSRIYQRNTSSKHWGFANLKVVLALWAQLSIFLWLRANCTSFSGNYLLKTFAFFLMDVGVFLLISRSFIHTREISPPPMICVVQMHPRLSSDLA